MSLGYVEFLENCVKTVSLTIIEKAQLIDLIKIKIVFISKELPNIF